MIACPPRAREGYQPASIFNADGTGRFFRAVPNHSLVSKKDACKGGKQAKDRLMALLATSTTGEKLKPLVIGCSKELTLLYKFFIAVSFVKYFVQTATFQTQT